jgi:hypothetical protein
MFVLAATLKPLDPRPLFVVMTMAPFAARAP